jgi:hypothetical protein
LFDDSPDQGEPDQPMEAPPTGPTPPTATSDPPPAPADPPPAAEPQQVVRRTDDLEETRALPWVPAFDAADDLAGLLRARSPLLSRAFGTRPDKPL